MNIEKVPGADRREPDTFASGIAIGLSLAGSSIGPTESSHAASVQPVEPVTIAAGRMMVGPVWVPSGDLADQAVAAVRSALEVDDRRRPDGDEVIELWQAAEQILTQDERDELRPLFHRLIGHDARASIGRGAVRSGGGE